MAAYLGELGNLVEVACAADLSVASERPVRYQSTIGGSMFAQVGPRTRRAWDVRLPRTSTPAEVSTWRAFVEGEFGNGPWWFVPDGAASTNLLSQRASVLDTGVVQAGTSVHGGPLDLTEGTRAGRSWLVSSGTLVIPWAEEYEFVPVVPGLPVTASVWVAGAAAVRMRVRFYRADGSIARTLGDARSTTSDAERLSLSTTAQPDEASLLVLLDHTSASFRVARPAVSWTASVRPWSVGEGAPAVHVAEMDQDVTLAVPGREMVGAAFRVQEVG